MPSFSDTLGTQILRALAEPAASLDAVSKAHGISVADLALWLTTPKARDLMLTIERGGYAHVRMAASLNLSAAVSTLVQILADFRDSRNASSCSSSASPSPTVHPAGALQPLPAAAALKADANSLRHAEIARKAAYHLYRLSRIVPIDDSQLAHARSLMPDRTARAGEPLTASAASPLRRTAGCHGFQPVEDDPASPSSSCSSPPPGRTMQCAEVNDSTSVPHAGADADSLPPVPVEPNESPLPLRPSAPAGPSSPPIPPSSPRPSASSAFNDSSPSPSSPSRPSRSDSPSSPPRPSASSAFNDSPSSPPSLDELNSNLEELAHSLGIDTSDLDENAPLPPEFLATLPPELAAFLSETDPPHASDSPSRAAPTPEPLSASP